MTRRQALTLPFAALAPALAQNIGMGSRNVKPAPRGKPSGIPFQARFTNVAHQAGLRAPVVYGDVAHNDYILESMGCGAAFIDYDNDGWQDILILTGRRWKNSPDDAIVRLYHNNRDGTFRDVTAKSGLGRNGWTSGVTVGDYDNDGFDDLFITCYGQNLLFHNNGDGTFTDVTEKAGLIHAGVRFGSGCTWIDYDRDGKLDLFVAHYMLFDRDAIPIRGQDRNCNYRGVPVYCRPDGMPQEPCRLYHNNGDGTFTDVSEKAGLLRVKPGYPLTAVTADFDGDGWPDLYIACDMSPSLMLRNNRDGTFAEQGLESGVAVSEDGQNQAGMGIGIGDYDVDGNLDIFKTHFSGDTPGLYRNNGKGEFRDVTFRSGLGVETRYVSWGAAMLDFDNDGLPDLLFATGMVYPEVDKGLPDTPYKTPCVLYRNLGGGKFEEVTSEAGPGLTEAHSSRGVAFGDFDNDGDIDVLVINVNEPPSLLRNDVVGGGHWLKVQLVGNTSNRSAIGATVTVQYADRKQAQAVMAQSSYLSVNDRRLHFGLGGEKRAAIEIRWPNGGREKIESVDADRLLVIEEGKGIVRWEAYQK